MKRCGICKLELSIDEFHHMIKNGQDVRQSQCKTCCKARDADNYQKNKDKIIARKIRQKLELKDEIRLIKSNNPCTDCGNKFHFSAMHFDHLPGFIKIDNIGNMLGRPGSRKRIMEEIKKCELVCANCHSVRTYERMIESNLALVAELA